MYGEDNIFECFEVFCLWIKGSVWFIGEYEEKGVIVVGEYVDFVVFDCDFLIVFDVEICDMKVDLIVIGGSVVFV